MNLLALKAEEIMKNLPHGSGINCNWEIEKHTRKQLIFKNCWHCMDEHGFYDGYLPLRVIIFQHKQNKIHQLKDENKVQIIHLRNDIDFRIQFRESAKKYLYGTKDYLYDLFHESLQNVITERYTVINKSELKYYI